MKRIVSLTLVVLMICALLVSCNKVEKTGAWENATYRRDMEFGEGAKTVLPSKACAKVSCRLVANQDHEKISQQFIDYITATAPEYVSVKVTPMHGGQGYVCPITLPAYKAAEKGFAKAFGKQPLAVRRGGSSPIISDFEKILGIKTILMGFGLESDAIHSPNENFPLDIFRKGIEAVVEFHKNLD